MAERGELLHSLAAVGIPGSILVSWSQTHRVAKTGSTAGLFGGAINPQDVLYKA